MNKIQAALFHDQILTTVMSQGGDSGSEVFKRLGVGLE